jgi:PAS domain S-box-containing protein
MTLPTSKNYSTRQQLDKLRLAILEKIAAGGELQDILDRLVLIVEGELPDIICSILLIDSTGQYFQWGAAPSLPNTFNAMFQGRPIGPDSCACGVSAYTRKRVIVEDIHTQPSWNNHRELAKTTGIAACWAEPIISSQGEVLGTFSIFHRKRLAPDDNEIQLITHMAHLAGLAIERSRFDSALTASEIRYKALFEQANDAIFLLEGSNFVECNDKTLEIYGCTREDILFKKPIDFSPAFQPNGQPSAVLASKRINDAYNGTPQRFEWRHLRLDGTPFDVEVSLKAINQNSRRMLLAVVRDITESKRAERELSEHRRQLLDLVEARTADLEENRRRLEALLDHLPVIFYLKDMQGRYQRINRRFRNEIGVGEKDVIGLTDREIFPDDTAEMIQSIDKQVLANGDAVTFDEQVNHIDGTLHDYLTTKLPLRDSDGKINGLIGIATDITEQKALQRELADARDQAERLSRIKGEFLANMSHEIRTPINAVLGLSRIGLRDSQNARETSLFENINKSADYLLAVINNVLDLSKLDAGMLDIAHQPFQPAALMKKAVNMITAMAEEKGLVIRLETDPALPEWLLGDTDRISQILINLLSNAVKFTSKGHIHLAIRFTGELTLFEVSDTGVGMTEQQLSKLFTPFQQATDTSARQFEGTGLGLAISMNLAKLMKGNIEVASKPGVGSTFTLCLPLEITRKPSEVLLDSNRAQETGVLSLRGVRILAAEDNALNREVLEDLLRHLDADVTFAMNGKEAVELVRDRGRDEFDVVLMDVQMPVVDGYIATWQINAIAPGLPVIALTAHALDEEKKRCLAAGMVDRITKPVDPHELINVITRHTSASRATSNPGKQPALEQNSRHLINWNALKVRFEGNDDLMMRLVEITRESEAGTPDRLLAAVENRDYEFLFGAAHSLRSVAAYIEAGRLRSAAEKTEAAARTRNAEALMHATDMARLLDQTLDTLADADKHLLTNA